MRKSTLTPNSLPRSYFFRAITLLLIFPLFGCDPSPEIKAGKPFPVCRKTGRVYSVRDVIDAAVERQIRVIAAAGYCKQHYQTVSEFHALNPHCCEIDYEHYANSEERIVGRNLFVDGYLIGTVKVVYKCDGDPFKTGWEDGAVEVTTCGVVVKSFSGGPYWPKRSNTDEGKK
jgi:hypothetical protein